MKNEYKYQLPELQSVIQARYDDLSKRLKEVARYMLDNANDVAFDTVASISEKTKIPPSTLIRFANEFGFSGFNEMKQVFRQHYLETTGNYSERVRLFRSSVNDSSELPETPLDVLKVSSFVNNQALEQLSSQITDEQLTIAIDLIRNADNIYVVGFRRSFSLASYFTYALRHLELKAHLVDGIGGMYFEQLNMTSDKDVVIAISYTPYAKEALELISQSAQRNTKLIVFTDSLVSPLVAFNDVCFIVKEAQLNGFRSQIASMSLIQSLVISLALDKTSTN